MPPRWRRCCVKRRSSDSRILPGVSLLRDSFESRLTGTRIASAIAVGTGLLTLLIACLGIFGVVSYGATLRVKEFGIHIALGRRGVVGGAPGGPPDRLAGRDWHDAGCGRRRPNRYGTD